LDFNELKAQLFSLLAESLLHALVILDLLLGEDGLVIGLSGSKLWKTMRASLCAAAVMALGAPSFARIRRKYWPSHDWLRKSACAAMRSALASRWLTERVRELSTLPPLTRLSGHSPSHDANAAALRNLDRSRPTSLNST
jgi:hypothetical protein